MESRIMEDFYDDPQIWPRSAPRWWLQPALLWQRWCKASSDRAALAALDAQVRRDIGVSAAEIARVCDVPWWRWPER